LPEGQTWTGTFGFKNISPLPFPDSLTVHITLRNTEALRTQTQILRIAPPAAGETVYFPAEINTLDWAGKNHLKVFVNPRILPEQIFENNVAELLNYLHVQPDVYNPVLEVTVDGRLLRNGDFVSPHPTIRVRVWDENRFIRKTSPDGIKIFLTYPNETLPVEISFSRPDVVWYPATDTSDFLVVFTPQNLPEGVYKLQVEARDNRNNVSGPVPYRITFEVRYDQQVVLVGPSPNPFTNRLNFMLSVSGESPPDFVLIDIINLQGKLIRQLRFENLIIGTQVLQWDGTDQGGHLPDSGLYFYRLRVIRDGKDLHVVNPVDRSFKNGYGKLLRIP
jgi:hypothetical protein